MEHCGRKIFPLFIRQTVAFIKSFVATLSPKLLQWSKPRNKYSKHTPIPPALKSSQVRFTKK
jgi:hypothetical protein